MTIRGPPTSPRLSSCHVLHAFPELLRSRIQRQITKKPHDITANSERSSPRDSGIGYSGDWCCAEAMILGADAWYSVLGGLLPNPCVRIVRAAQAGDAEEARRINQEVLN